MKRPPLLPSILRATFHFSLAVALAAAPLPAMANRTIASVRVPPPRTASALHLTARNQRDINHAVLHLYADKYQAAKSLEGFDREFLQALKPTDRRDLLPEFATVAQWPSLRQVDDKLIFTIEHTEMTIEIANILRPVIVVNGMSWTISAGQPLLTQIRMAVKHFEILQRRESAWYQLFVPHADAILSKLLSRNEGLIVAVVCTLAASALQSMISPTWDLICGAVIADTTLETKLNLCYDWRQRLIAARRLRKENEIGSVDAMKKDKIAAEQKETLKWVPNHDKQVCDVMNDKGRGLYVVDFLQLKRGAGDAWATDGKWFSVVQKYAADGSPEHFWVTAKGTDTSDKSWQEKAINVLDFENGQLSAINYKNTNYNMLDPASLQMLKQPVTTVDDSKLNDEQLQRQTMMGALVKAVNKMATDCGDYKAVDDLQKQNVQVDKAPSPQLDPNSALPTAAAPPAEVPNAAQPAPAGIAH